MRRCTSFLSLTAAAALLSLTAPARADLVGIQLLDKTIELGGDPDTIAVFELYALFNEPGDALLGVFDGEIIASANFIHHSSDRDGSCIPLTKAVYTASGTTIDSFVTIGFKYGGSGGNPDGPDIGTAGDFNKTLIDPSFCEESFLEGSTIDDCAGPGNGDGAGWYDSGVPTSIAGVAGNDPELKVLLGRFTVPLSDPGGCASLLVDKLKLAYKSPNIAQTNALSAAIEACDILLPDCNDNGVIDIDEIVADPALDCNDNLLLDSCEIADGASQDADANGVPDECEMPREIFGDLNGDEIVDGADLGLLLAAWETHDAAADLNDDGAVDGADLGLLLSGWTG